jgi:hypothetical protein
MRSAFETGLITIQGSKALLVWRQNTGEKACIGGSAKAETFLEEQNERVLIAIMANAGFMKCKCPKLLFSHVGFR